MVPLTQHIQSCRNCQVQFQFREGTSMPLVLIESNNGMTSVMYMTNENRQRQNLQQFNSTDGYATIYGFLHYFPVNNIPEYYGNELQDQHFAHLDDGIINMHDEAGFIRIKCLQRSCQEVLRVLDRMKLFVCHEDASYNMHVYGADAIPRVELGLDSDEQFDALEFVTKLENENRNKFIDIKDIRVIRTDGTAQGRMRHFFTVGPRNAHCMIGGEFLRFNGRDERVMLVANPFDDIQ